MPINEGFHPAQPLRLVIADEMDLQGTENGGDQRFASSRVVKASALSAEN